MIQSQASRELYILVVALHLRILGIVGNSKHLPSAYCYNTVQCSVKQHTNTTQYNAKLYNTIHKNTIQHLPTHMDQVSALHQLFVAEFVVPP